jgi:hypothetical protein
MSAVRKFASSTILAAILAGAAPGVTQASAGEVRVGFFGFVRAVHFGLEREPVCAPGHKRWILRELCRPAGYAVNYCWNTEVSYRPEICH